MKMDKDILTKKQAKEIVIDRKDGMVHTFFNPSFGLIGGDHSKESIFEDIDNAYMCKRTGKMAQKMKHGLVIIPFKGYSQSDLLFVETTSKLNKKIKEIKSKQVGRLKSKGDEDG